MKIRVELHHWTGHAGYSYSETFDHYETENVAENEAEVYIKALDKSFDLKANEAINVELYNEDDELVSEYWFEGKKYYLFEKNADGGNNYRMYSFKELKEFFRDEEASDDYEEAWKRIEDIEDFKRFVEEYVNNYQGMHFHNYYIEEV